MKFKNLTKKQIIISIDRLTRFKPTEEKYLRVFTDIILSNLIEPKIKKVDVEKMDYQKIKDIAVQIFNASFDIVNKDLSVNQKLRIYENSTFENDENVQKLLDNELDYNSALSLVDDDCDVLNLKWLKSLKFDDDMNITRQKYSLLYPIKTIVIAEGITEEILLPKFADFCGYDFNKYGIKVIAAGGKNQVVKLYYKLSKDLKLPIFVLLDKDAQTNEESINTRLRDIDEVYLLDSGEFEDLLPKSLIVKTVNNEFKNFVSITEKDLTTDISMVKTLEELFKDKCLHEFKKAEFALRVKQQISSDKDISDEVRKIVNEIKKLSHVVI